MKLSKLDSIKAKALKALELWAMTFKLIGSPEETPRFSQLMRRGDVYVLKSTQKDLFYDLGLTEEENNLLLYADTRKLWDWWKQIRTEYLLENHKTINPY